MDLQYTLQLKNKPRTVKQVARVFQKMLRNAAKKKRHLRLVLVNL